MSRNTWRLVLIIAVVAWSYLQFTPTTGTDLPTMFRSRAVRASDKPEQVALLDGVIKRMDELQKANDAREFDNVLEAIGTNDIAPLFPFFEQQARTNADPTRYILNRLQREGAGKIKLGLDLQGGTEYVVGVDFSAVNNTNKLGTNAPQIAAEVKNQRALAQAIEVLRKRVDKFGVAEPIIQPQGEDRINIQLPGLSEAYKEKARSQIEQAAYLEFRVVHPQSDAYVAQGMSEPGYEFKRHPHRAQNGGTEIAGYLVRKKAEHGLDGKYVRYAVAQRDPMSGAWEISLTFNTAGAELFGQVTTENVHNQLAIMLSGELYSAPNINEPIMTGSARISGSFTAEEAQSLANVLENPLEVPVKIISSREISPKLGADSIASGIKAAIGGIIAVAAFMLIYYMLAGLVANVALILNVIILIGVMCSVGTTLTLPGIAGIVLTVGMAVDANVLIFERIREELALGKSLRGALAAGYDRAFGTIFDSHVTTLISSVILIFMGTGMVKGFGVTLTIGVAASLFTALVVTRLIFDFLIERNIITSLKMFHFLPDMKLDFMKYAFPAFVASWIIIAVGLGYGVGVRGHKMFGVEFAGGDQQTYQFTHQVPEEKLRAVIADLKLGEASLAYQKDISSGKESLNVTTAFNSADQVTSALTKNFPDAQFNRVDLVKVGAVVGDEIMRAAIVASLLSLLGILVYVAFRYEFSFAIGAVVAVIHDVLMTIGCYCLAGREFNATMVAAVLTIIGFSINDTIVIFDRIREDLKLGVRGTFREVLNKALNQTLSRTIITSGTVFLATASLYIFGGGVINDFAFTFLVGIITGTYSSIFIAAFLVYRWHKGQRPAIGSTVSVQAANVDARS
ncbi:MAG: hypothetical protein RLZZ350_232 [Verrucomicrobiota bacterium]|jgi:SecD/SecF fusion protein